MEQRAPALVDGVRAAPRPDSSLLAQRLRQALARSLGTPAAGLAQDGGRRAGGLIPGVEPERPDPRVQELLRRPIRPDGALALALNSFLPWLSCPESLRLGGVSRFRELNFDARCPTGVRGTPPRIELVASGADGVVGATVRVFDYLGRRQSRLSPAYAGFAVPAALASWADLVGAGTAGAGGRSGYVDVPALAKLAFGLGQIFARRPVKLLYLFLEPVAAGGIAPFAEHRAELARLVERTRGSAVALVPISFHELWDAWSAGNDAPPGLRATIADLSRRYAVAMPR